MSDGNMTIPIRDVISDIQKDVKALQQNFSSAHTDTMTKIDQYVAASEKRLQALEADIPLRSEIRTQFKDIQIIVGVHSNRLSTIEEKLNRLGNLEAIATKADRFIASAETLQVYQRWLIRISVSTLVALVVAIIAHFWTT